VGPEAPAEGSRRYDELARRHSAELRLSGVVGEGRGLSGLIRETASIGQNPTWLVDAQNRLVARAVPQRIGPLSTPDLAAVLARLGPFDLTEPEPMLVAPPGGDTAQARFIVTPVARDGTLFAYLLIAERSGPFTGFDLALSERAAFHLATEYQVQRRVASMAWDARSSLARQLVRNTGLLQDLRASAEYLGVRIDADRVVVFVADPEDGEPHTEQDLAELVGRQLDTEVLVVRTDDGTVLLVETDDDAAPAAAVGAVKRGLTRLLRELHDERTVVGISGVAKVGELYRAHLDAREVVRCLGRFGGSESRVVSVDDLGPARLFLAHSEVSAVQRYVKDVLGRLLVDTPTHLNLLRTLRHFFETGRSVRDSAARLGVHENTVRLRLAKVAEVTGLDVIGDANHQLSIQTALLALWLTGHPGLTSTTTLPSAVRSSREESASAARSIG
jgi:sugar diacid utilization regulator